MKRPIKADILAKILRSPPTEAVAEKREYVPRPPGVSFGEAVSLARETNRNRLTPPKRCEPHEAHFKKEQLESNVFCRLLAARPKMDSQTRMILPSPLLAKIGFSEGKLGPVSARETKLKGPRAYISPLSQLPLAAMASRLSAKALEYKKFKATPEFVDEYRKVLVSDIEKLVKKYRSFGQVIAVLTRGYPTKTGDAIVIDVGELPPSPQLPALPETITVGKNQYGVKLAGLLYVYTQVEKWRTLTATSKRGTVTHTK